VRKVGLLILALVMALGVLGVSYAAWAKTINIWGTVNTGDTAAEFSSSSVWQGQFNNMVMVSTAPETDTKWLDVTVDNAYPGTLVTNVPFAIHNIGTVPIHVTDVVLVDNPGNVLESFSSVAPADLSISTGAYSGNGYISFKINSDPTKIDPLTTYHFTVGVNFTVSPGD